MKQIIIGVLIFFGGLGVAYAAQDSYPEEILYPVKVGINEPLGSVVMINSVTEAELQAKLFAKRVVEVSGSDKGSILDEDTTKEQRVDINKQFNKAFDLIKEVEKDMGIAEATVAREVMEEAIDYYMQSNTLHNKEIRNDLELYSKIMTESLIETSLRD